MFSIRFNRLAIAAAVAPLLLAGPALAQTPDHPADSSAQFPTSRDLKGLTTAGSYLAARHAGQHAAHPDPCPACPASRGKYDEGRAETVRLS